MNFSELNKDNFLLFAIKHYENPRTSTQEEFEDDLRRFKYVKRWLRKYDNGGEINIHLLLNHILIIFNCWGEAAVPMLFYKLEPQYWSYLKSFLIYLERIPLYPETGLHYLESDVELDTYLGKIDA